MPAELLLLRAEADARHVLLDHQAGNALRPVDAGADHGDIDLVLAAARDERLGAGDDIMIAVLHRAGLQRRGVGAGAGLGQAIGADPLHRHHRGQIFVLHRLRAEAVDHPARHVVDRDEGRGGGAAIGHRLHDQRRLEPAEADAARFLGDVDASRSRAPRPRGSCRAGRYASRPTRRRAGVIASAVNCCAISWIWRCSSVRSNWLMPRLLKLARRASRKWRARTGAAPAPPRVWRRREIWVRMRALPLGTTG